MNGGDKSLARIMESQNFVLFRTDSEGRVLAKQPNDVVPYFKFNRDGVPKKIGDVSVKYALFSHSEGRDVMLEPVMEEEKKMISPSLPADAVMGDLADSWLWRQIAVFPMLSALFVRIAEAFMLILMADWVCRHYYDYVHLPVNVNLSYWLHILNFLCYFIPYGGLVFGTIYYCNRCVSALMRLAGGARHRVADNLSEIVQIAEGLNEVEVDPNMNFLMRHSQSFICFCVKASKYTLLIIPLSVTLSMFGLLSMCLYTRPIPLEELWTYAYGLFNSVTNGGAGGAYRGGGAVPPFGRSASQGMPPPMVPPYRR